MRTALVAGIIAVTAAGCTKASNGQISGTQHSWTHPGVLRIAENTDTTTLNPVVGVNAVAADLSPLIYSYTVVFDDHAKPVPDAVTEVPTVANGDVSRDGLTLKYKLRHDIKWQDGAQLTCNDLRFTWRVVVNPHTNVAATDGYRDIKDIDCSDPFVAVVHMKRVYAPYLQQLWGLSGNAPILPEHLLGSYLTSPTSINNAPYNSKPIGSGPFKVIEWQRGTMVRLAANPNYYRGKPRLKEIDYYFEPDENTLETQLQTHNIDMIPRGTGLNWPRYQALANDPKNGLVAVRNDSFAFVHIDFNLKNPILADVNVRRALAYATNRQEIIGKIFHGSATASETDQHPKLSWAYTTDIQHYPYDPDKAKQILDAHGWKLGPDGVRVKKAQRLAVTFSTLTESTGGREMQALLQRAWRDIGVEADVKNYSTAQMFQNGAAGVLEGGHYDIAMYVWVDAADPDNSGRYSSWNFGPTGQNTLFWKNDKVDAAERAALTTADQETRKVQYAIVQQQMALDVPTVIISFAKYVSIYNSDLKGFKPSPVISPYWNAWQYSI